MSRYIDADKIDWRMIKLINSNVADEHMIYQARKLVAYQPTVDVVEVVHAEWIKNWEIGYSACSHCGKGYLWEDYKGVADWEYCPNCGARMDGGRDDKQRSD